MPTGTFRINASELETMTTLVSKSSKTPMQLKISVLLFSRLVLHPLGKCDARIG